MTVEELIEELKKQDPKSNVFMKFRLEIGAHSLVMPTYIHAEVVHQEGDIVVITHPTK